MSFLNLEIISKTANYMFIFCLLNLTLNIDTHGIQIPDNTFRTTMQDDLNDFDQKQIKFSSEGNNLVSSSV